MVRKLQASKGTVAWAAEAVPYTAETTIVTPFGIVEDAIDWPVANPKTALGNAGGRRGPAVYSKDEYDLTFSIPFQVVDGNVPFQCALGNVAAGSGTGYTSKIFTEEDTLPTISILHEQTDAAFSEIYAGCKADLALSAKRGEPLKATMDFVAASRTVDTTETGFATIALPTLQPFRFWMIGALATVGGNPLASINSVDLKWSNGLEAKGSDGARGAYDISEGEGAGKYDMKVGFLPTNNALFADAWEDAEPIDIMIPFVRTGASVAAATDALIVTLQDCVIMDAPIPLGDKGSLESELSIGPLNTQIEIRTPTA